MENIDDAIDDKVDDIFKYSIQVNLPPSSNHIYEDQNEIKDQGENEDVVGEIIDMIKEYNENALDSESFISKENEFGTNIYYIKNEDVHQQSYNIQFKCTTSNVKVQHHERT
jgi:hypothetical protein